MWVDRVGNCSTSFALQGPSEDLSGSRGYWPWYVGDRELTTTSIAVSRDTVGPRERTLSSSIFLWAETDETTGSPAFAIRGTTAAHHEA